MCLAEPGPQLSCQIEAGAVSRIASAESPASPVGSSSTRASGRWKGRVGVGRHAARAATPPRSPSTNWQERVGAHGDGPAVAPMPPRLRRLARRPRPPARRRGSASAGPTRSGTRRGPWSRPARGTFASTPAAAAASTSARTWAGPYRMSPSIPRPVSPVPAPRAHANAAIDAAAVAPDVVAVHDPHERPVRVAVEPLDELVALVVEVGRDREPAVAARASARTGR